MKTEKCADIIAFDSEKRPILTVEVKARPVEPVDLAEMNAIMSHHGTKYAMLVDPGSIRIWKNRTSKPLVLPTAEILRHYEPSYGSEVIGGYYLSALVEAWLRDLAYRWKSDEPPALKELSKLGLVAQLDGGTTEAESYG